MIGHGSGAVKIGYEGRQFNQNKLIYSFLILEIFFFPFGQEWHYFQKSSIEDGLFENDRNNILSDIKVFMFISICR